jgi:hypothetical protein
MVATLDDSGTGTVKLFGIEHDRAFALKALSSMTPNATESFS